jgi:NAD(P)-dependent dehydrogenase (short-subunit alcohol dehydrogenase family)
MQSFHGKVAVITGAASGIGWGLAERCAHEGMRVVLADVEAPALAQAERELRAQGAEVLGVRTDVSRRDEVEALARRALDAFGAVHLLCNNAGVGAGSSIWDSTLTDWEWVMGVNLWGVIHGLRVFVPIMLAQDTEGHIVNTASIAGLLQYHPSAPYQVTKHAVVALSEHLYYTLKQRSARINVSVLCPGWVNTRIMDSERNRPPELQNEASNVPPSPEMEAVVQEFRRAAEAGMSPQQLADFVFQAICAEQLYVLPDHSYDHLVQQRMENILQH